MPAAYYDLYGEEGSFFVLKLNLLVIQIYIKKISGFDNKFCHF